jgi:hypothetical protein
MHQVRLEIVDAYYLFIRGKLLRVILHVTAYANSAVPPNSYNYYTKRSASQNNPKHSTELK